MEEVWYHRYLDLPQPPKWMILDAITNLPDMKSFESKATIEWINTNIGGNLRDIEVTWSTTGLDSIGVHTDRGRNYALMYLLDQGGSNCVSTVYQEEGFPVIRERATHVHDRGSLKIIHSYIAEKNRWYILDTRVLHTVDNIEKFRIAIQCSYDDVSHFEKVFIA